MKVSRFFSCLSHRSLVRLSVRPSLGFLLLLPSPFLFRLFPFSIFPLFFPSPCPLFFLHFFFFPQTAHCRWDMRSGEGEEIIERTGKKERTVALPGSRRGDSLSELAKRRLFFLYFLSVDPCPPSSSFPPPRPPEASTSRRPPSRCRVHAGPCEGPGGDRQEGAPCAAQCAAVRGGAWTATTSGSRWAGGAGQRRVASGPAGAR